MSDIVERGARAMAVANGEDPDMECIAPSGEIVPGWLSYAPLLRAAIAAMREPSEAMEKAYRDAVESHCMGVAIGAGHAWSAMIDAALGKKP